MTLQYHSLLVGAGSRTSAAAAAASPPTATRGTGSAGQAAEACTTMSAWLTVSRCVLGAFFVGAGVLHFTKTPFYLAVMPPYVPRPLEMVYFTGVCEIGGGLGLLHPATRRAAAAGLAALLVCVFPANVHMAQHPELTPEVAPWALWLRLPLQGALLAWVWNAGLKKQ
jgi:uncharacterized membrane protein